MRGIYELLITLIAFCGVTQVYLLHANVSLSVMLLVDSIIFVGFLEGIVFHREKDLELKGMHKRITWLFILLLVNAGIFFMIWIEDSVVSTLGAGSLLIFMNFEQVGAFLVFKYDNRRQIHEIEEM